MTAPQSVPNVMRPRRLLAGDSMILTTLRLMLVYLVALLFQLTFFAEVRVAGVAPELPALVAVLAAVFAGARNGSLIAFLAGLMWDVYLSTPLGLSAIAFALVAHALGVVTEDLVHSTRLRVVVLAFLGTAAMVTAYALLGTVVGGRVLIDDRLLTVVLVASALNALLSVVVAPAMRWAVRSEPMPRKARRREPAERARNRR